MSAWRKQTSNWRDSAKRTSLPQQGRRESAPAPAAPAKKPIKVEGDPDMWVTLQKIADPQSGWIKTTRAMHTPAGVLVNTCSRKQGQNVAAEALVLVPGCTLKKTGSAWQIAML